MFIDPNACQILVADLQPETLALTATHPATDIERTATQLVTFAASLGVPVTFSLVPGTDGTAQPPSALRPLVDEGNLFLRQSASAFTDERVVSRLAAQGRTVIIVIGITTEVVVVHSAKDAIDAGYAVIVPVDAIGGLSTRSEAAALAQIGAAGGQVTAAATLISMFAPEFAGEPGRTGLQHILKAAGYGNNQADDDPGASPAQ